MQNPNLEYKLFLLHQKLPSIPNDVLKVANGIRPWFTNLCQYEVAIIRYYSISPKVSQSVHKMKVGPIEL